VLGYSRPSLTGLDHSLSSPTQHYVLGYSRPSLTGLGSMIRPAIIYPLLLAALCGLKANVRKGEQGQPAWFLTMVGR
jgi:hypothetical protein